MFASPVGIGKWNGVGLLSEEHGASDAHLKGVNVVGMGLFGHNDVARSFTKLLADATHMKLDRPAEVWVTDGQVAFRISPKHGDVAALKLAIKEYRMYTMDPTLLIIKDPATGNVMGDEDALHADVKYVFELPPVNK